MSEKRYERQERIWGMKGQKLINNTSILLVGVGGTGCEILKNILLLGFGEIHIVDLDLIEVTNLNRQLFFQDKDVGKYKVEVAAEKSKILNPSVKIVSYNKKVQDISRNVFNSCDYFISALDNISARLFLNQIAVELNKPLLDCGSEGFFGHVQVVIPRKTPCLMCQNLWVHPNMNFKCSYAINPRTPLDCAIEASDQFFLTKNRLPNPNNNEDIELLLKYAEKHAKKFNIIGINTEKIKDALKGTVESLVTTNSIIGSVLVNELLKIVISGIDVKNQLELKIINFFQFQGKTETGWCVPLERNEECPVCGINQRNITENRNIPLIQLIQKINNETNNILKLPLVIYNNKIIFREKIHLEDNKLNIDDSELSRLLKLETTSIKEIFKEHNVLLIKDESTGLKFNIKINFK